MIQKVWGGDFDGDSVICENYNNNIDISKLIKKHSYEFYNAINPKLVKTFTKAEGFVLRIKEIIEIKQITLLEDFTYGYNMYSLSW